MTINELKDIIHDNAKNKGFHRVDDNKVLMEAVLLSLIGTEVSEAIEAHRVGDIDNLQEELADIVIRTLDVSAYLGVDIEAEISKKMEKNKSRPMMHGKRY